jgi:type I restriction enzyme S subunit
MRDGWTETTLGEVATTVAPSKTPAGECYVGLEHFDSGSPRIARWGNTDDVLSATTPFEPGDVLFSKLRPYLRKVAVADQSGRCTTEALVYRPMGHELTAGYLGLLLQSESAIRHADSSSVGSRMPRTSTKIYGRVSEWPYLPSAEQARIVDLIAAVG